MASLILATVGDGILTFGWVFCASALGAATSFVTAALQVESNYIATLSITVSILFVLVFIFNLIADALGGASFNPIGNASLYTAGMGSDTLLSMALRFPAQTAGAVGGAIAIMGVMPEKYRHLLSGPYLKVDLQTAAIAEGVLTFIITCFVLIIVINGPSNRFTKSWLLAMVTTAIVTVGADYTGPSMNPANAYGWAYVDNWHNTWEHFIVYWICPFVGSILAAWLFRAINISVVNKVKTA